MGNLDYLYSFNIVDDYTDHTPKRCNCKILASRGDCDISSHHDYLHYGMCTCLVGRSIDLHYHGVASNYGLCRFDDRGNPSYDLQDQLSLDRGRGQPRLLSRAEK